MSLTPQSVAIGAAAIGAVGTAIFFYMQSKSGIPKKGRITLGYWKIRGLAAPMRMMLHYVGADFEDIQYADAKKWFGQDKPQILSGNALANLPYIKCGDDVICQTNACFTYLGEMYGLNGSTAHEKIKNETILCEVYDLRNKMIDLSYPFRNICRTQDEFNAQANEQITKVVRAAYGKFEAWLEANGTTYSVSNSPSTADFHLWEMIDQHEKLATHIGKPSPIAAYPRLSLLYSNMRQLSQLSNYFASDDYKLPCNNPIANAWFV